MAVINVEKRINNVFQQVDADFLLSRSGEKNADRLRMEITHARNIQAPPPIRCGICKEPVYIKANPLEDNLYHFSHFKTDDPVLKKCIQRTDNQSNLELVRALKYQGAQESQLHYRLKHLIAALLKRDTSIGTESVKVEAPLLREKEWRKPDVQAIHRNRLIAFEVQVSTEIASMIVAREYFYERFGNILWILPRFSPEKINQSQRDILTTNHDHLYVLDHEMRRLSKSKKMLHLQAWIHWPVLDNGKLKYTWKSQVVSLKDISFKNGHAFVLDVENEEKRINAAIKELEAQRRETEHNQYKEIIRRKVSQNQIWTTEWANWWRRWQTLTEALANPRYRAFLRRELELELPWNKQSVSLAGIWLSLHGIHISQCNCSQFVIRAVLCASRGNLDHGYSSWKWVAKTLLKEHPAWFPAFYNVLKANKHGSIWQGLKSDPAIHEQVSEIKRLPTRLNYQQKNLLGLLEPKLKLEVPSYSLERYSVRGCIFLYGTYPSYEYGEPDTIFPGELAMVSYHMKRLKHKRFGYSSNNIIEALKLMAKNGNYLPFPNLPLKDSRGTYYYIDESDCDEILPIWDEQLTNLEIKFNIMTGSKA